MIGALAAAIILTGGIPVEFGIPSQIVWIAADRSFSVGCEMTAADRWRCDTSGVANGIVLLFGQDRVGYQVFDGRGMPADAMRLNRWGRFLVLLPSAGQDELQSLTMTVWKPDRSVVRMRSQRFLRAEDRSVEIVRLSETVAWVAGAEIDRDGFVSIEGPLVGSTRVAIASLAEGPAATPLFHAVPIPFTLNGRIETSRFENVPGAEVELFEPVAVSDADLLALKDQEPMILHATTRSDSNGAFAFERLAPGSYLIVVTDLKRGRGSFKVRTLSEPAIVRLVAPVRATGRVLKNQIPVAGARVRFVPDIAAFTASTDPLTLLTEETDSSSDGRFELILPPSLAGTVQAVAPDGSSVRVPIEKRANDRQINLGDLLFPDQRHLIVRLFDPETCEMSAAGPIGTLGLTIVKSVGFGAVHSFELPEGGEWALNAECGGVSYSVQPRIVQVPPTGPDTIVDARVVR